MEIKLAAMTKILLLAVKHFHSHGANHLRSTAFMSEKSSEDIMSGTVHCQYNACTDSNAQEQQRLSKNGEILV